jgi:LmbE family N-acetylglucosaminyl deacetylase
MRSIIVAPHPDDEILGAGGTMIRRKAEGGVTAWLIVTCISVNGGWTEEAVLQREKEINKVRKLLQFDEIFYLKLPTASLDQLPIKSIVESISNVFSRYQPNEVFLPHISDIHSDHRIVNQATVSCTKWFRHPYINRVLSYETPSETDFGIGDRSYFRPNYIVDISSQIEQKLDALKAYESEIGAPPFPRSLDLVRALSQVRGATAGYKAAEAFELLLQRT